MYLLLKPNYQLSILFKTAIFAILIICRIWFPSTLDYSVFASEGKQIEIYKKKNLTKKKKKTVLNKNQVYFQKISENRATLGMKKIKKKKIKVSHHNEIDQKEQKYTDPYIRQKNDKKIIENIESIYGLISKMDNKSENKAGNINRVTSTSAINGISIGKVSYVILSNGDKIFKGGKLDNGCIVEDIRPNYILLNCNGYKKKKIL
jgi:hypothetical protein